MEHLRGIGTLFYMIDPYSTMYENISDLPRPDFMSKVLIFRSILSFPQDRWIIKIFFVIVIELKNKSNRVFLLDY